MEMGDLRGLGTKKPLAGGVAILTIMEMGDLPNAFNALIVPLLTSQSSL